MCLCHLQTVSSLLSCGSALLTLAHAIKVNEHVEEFDAPPAVVIGHHKWFELLSLVLLSSAWFYETSGRTNDHYLSTLATSSHGVVDIIRVVQHFRNRVAPEILGSSANGLYLREIAYRPLNKPGLSFL